MAQRKGVADWPSLGQWPMAGRNVDDMHFQAVAAARIIGRQALTGLALAHETAFWWTVGIFASGAVIAGALLRLARWVSRARPRHMPRRRRLLKARQTPPGVIPEHFRRQTPARCQSLGERGVLGMRPADRSRSSRARWTAEERASVPSLA